VLDADGRAQWKRFTGCAATDSNSEAITAKEAAWPSAQAREGGCRKLLVTLRKGIQKTSINKNEDQVKFGNCSKGVGGFATSDGQLALTIC